MTQDPQQRPLGDEPAEPITYENYQPRAKDGQIEIDAFGRPVDPTDPDLEDLGFSTGPQDPRPGDGYGDGRFMDGAAEGPQFQAFPFPGVSGTTRGGGRYYVGGGCLPMPLGCLGLLAALAALGGLGGRRY